MADKKIIKSAAGIIIAVIVFFSQGVRLPFPDNLTHEYFKNAITEAGLAYATIRAINASVSIIKESSLELEPAGIGISLALGQALDPIDDMTERLSDVLVTAITSLGLQKLIYEISVSLAPPVIGVCLFILSVLIWIKKLRMDYLYNIVAKFTMIIVIARFCLPVSSVINNFLYENYFADKIKEVRKELAIGSYDLDKLKNFSLPKVDGILGTIKNSSSFIKHKSGEFKKALVSMINNMENIIENLLELTFLYVGIFLIQVIILPLIVFWFLLKMINHLFSGNVPVKWHHPRLLEYKK